MFMSKHHQLLILQTCGIHEKIPYLSQIPVTLCDPRLEIVEEKNVPDYIVKFKVLHRILCCFVRYLQCKWCTVLHYLFFVFTVIVFVAVSRTIPNLLSIRMGLVSYCRFLDDAYVAAVLLGGRWTFIDSSWFSNKESSWRVFETSIKKTNTSAWRCTHAWYPPLSLFGPNSPQLLF